MAASTSQQQGQKHCKSAAQALAANKGIQVIGGLEDMAKEAMGKSVGASQSLTEMPRSIVAEPVQGWRPSARSTGIARTLSRKLEDMLPVPFG